METHLKKSFCYPAPKNTLLQIIYKPKCEFVQPASQK